MVDRNLLKDSKKVAGHVLNFYDLATGKMYEPIKPHDNVLYSKFIVYFKKYLYFIQADFNNDTLTMYEYLPRKELNVKLIRSLHGLHLYNLGLIPSDVGPYLVGQDISDEEDTYDVGYYPETFRFREDNLENFCFIKEHLLYFEDEIEEYDDDDNYIDSYSEIVVKDFNSNVLHRERGSLNLMPDGN